MSESIFLTEIDKDTANSVVKRIPAAEIIDDEKDAVEKMRRLWIPWDQCKIYSRS